MCDVAERLVQKGIAQGMAQGNAQGRAEAEADILKRVTANYMKQNPSLSKAEAEEMAKDILK